MPQELIRTLDRDFDWRMGCVRWPVTTDVGTGLAGVIAATTAVVWLDPVSGELSYRGVPVAELAATCDFEAVSFLLITGKHASDDPRGFTTFQQRLRRTRELPSDVVALIRDLDPRIHPTRLLRAGVSALGCHELSVEDDLAGERTWRELRIVGQVVALVGEIIRHRRGLPSRVVPRDVSLAAGVLAALHDVAPEPADVRALDLLWVLYAAHGLDAPTFTSLVVASCRADPYYNVVAGLSALWGRRQGAASECVLEQLRTLPDAAQARVWVAETLARGDRIEGFGHPAYHMPDPRVVLFREAAANMARAKGELGLYEAAREVDVAATAALAPKGVHANVNFYAALVCHLLGAEPALGPCLVAAARMAGLVALVHESLDDIRLHRPLCRYVGRPERSVPREALP